MSISLSNVHIQLSAGESHEKVSRMVSNHEGEGGGIVSRKPATAPVSCLKDPSGGWDQLKE